MRCQSRGLPPISIMGLGRAEVSSDRRVPNPPARIITFIEIVATELLAHRAPVVFRSSSAYLAGNRNGNPIVVEINDRNNSPATGRSASIPILLERDPWSRTQQNTSAGVHPAPDRRSHFGNRLRARNNRSVFAGL